MHIYINHPFRFEPSDCFWSKLITVLMAVLITVLKLISNLLQWIQERLNAVNYYREVLHFCYDRVHGSISGN